MNIILDWLKNNAEKHPHKTAISFENTEISYFELFDSSKKLAAAISADYKNKPIAVICERKPEVLVFFMAVLFSGNFYIPLDPEAPAKKINAILEDSAPRYIIGSDEAKSLLDNINFTGEYLTANNKSNVDIQIPDSYENTPIYMIYTSGSTGMPKGVLKSAGSVVSFVNAYCDTFDFSADEVIGNQAPFFFDASAKDIYLSLKLGATIELVPKKHFALPVKLVDYLNEHKISFISWVPTALSIVSQLNVFSHGIPNYLKKVFFVGEVMPVKHLNYWRKYLPNAQFVNLYGQSELAGICMYYDVKKDFNDDESLPMGKPLSNCKVYLLNENGIVNTPNTQGEMYLVSDALALEYYNDSKKTNACFIEKDFGDGPVRCFKTGDLAMFDEDNNYIFLSRVDFQIKHMGHRIELGEIETVAGSLECIKRCCCLYNHIKHEIVLFCEVYEESNISGGIEIKSLLKDKLSNYMMPAKVKIMDTLYINANGKIDRQKLKELL